NLPAIYSNLAAASIKELDSAKTVLILREGMARMEKSKAFSLAQICDARVALSTAYISNSQLQDADDILSLALKESLSISESKLQASELAKIYHCFGAVRLNQGNAKVASEYLEKAVVCAERAGPNDLGQLKASLSLWSLICKNLHEDAKVADIDARLKKLN
ncbi:MAG: hypothetical protein K2X81_14590, partial [Candidatus Obscuribacterales bacterium]|nr:hypothetical protein [Candidatus Obscuribacterales bacterium]